MHKILVLCVCLAAGAAEARQLKLAQLAPSSWLDTEVVSNVTCNLDLPSLKHYRLAVGLVGTPSNNVEVALGYDADNDGQLSLDEAALTLAWDCGAWEALGRGGEIEPFTVGPDSNGVVRAAISVDVRRHRSNPEWLYDRTWNLVRITTRGIDETFERVFLETRVSGTLLFIR